MQIRIIPSTHLGKRKFEFAGKLYGENDVVDLDACPICGADICHNGVAYYCAEDDCPGLDGWGNIGVKPQED